MGGRRRVGKSYPIRYPQSETSLFLAEIADFAVSVHHRLRLLAFPMRTAVPARSTTATARREISQVPMRSFCT